VELSPINLGNRLRDEIAEFGRSIFERGFTAGSSGNISVRLDHAWLLTPTNAASAGSIPRGCRSSTGTAISSRATRLLGKDYEVITADRRSRSFRRSSRARS
jgi:hypothetical protein